MTTEENKQFNIHLPVDAVGPLRALTEIEGLSTRRFLANLVLREIESRSDEITEYYDAKIEELKMQRDSIIERLEGLDN